MLKIITTHVIIAAEILIITLEIILETITLTKMKVRL